MTKQRTKVSENEPKWDPTHPEGQVSRILTWYNYNKNTEDAKKYFLEFLKQSGETTDTLTKIEECSSISIPSTIGWLCRIKTINGTDVLGQYDKNIENEKNKILQVVELKQKREAVEVQDKKVGIQEHMENKLNLLLGELAEKVDEFIINDKRSSLSVYDWMKDHPVKHQHALHISKYYEDTVLRELLEAAAGTCEQLTEAYSHLTKSELKRFISFIEMLVADAKKWGDVAKQISLNNRAPRAKKPKPAGKQVSSMKSQKEYELLKSVPPSQIVGATQLWVYNTKYKTLGVYICGNIHGFSVKGCTILNFDAKESICKTLRKPGDILPKVLAAGKVGLRKILPDIRAKEKKLTGRINVDTILLKAV